MSTIDVTKENFDELIQKDGIVFVDAWAEWCGPCKAFAPTFAKACLLYTSDAADE